MSKIPNSLKTNLKPQSTKTLNPISSLPLSVRSDSFLLPPSLSHRDSYLLCPPSTITTPFSSTLLHIPSSSTLPQPVRLLSPPTFLSQCDSFELPPPSTTATAFTSSLLFHHFRSPSKEKEAE